VTEVLSRLLNKSGYRNNPLILALPRSKATCRYLKVPAQAPKEIEKIVSLQASRYLPYPQDELISGYEIVSQDKEGYSDINLVIVHKDVISSYLNIGKGLKAQAITITLSSYGLVNLYNHLQPQSKSAAMLIDIDSNHMELVIIARGKLVFSRYFKADISNPDWKNIFISEVVKSRDAYVKEVGGEVPEKILVTGNQNLATEAVEAIRGGGGFKAEILAYEKASADTSFASLIGLGLKDIPYSLNLLPQESKDELKKRAQKTEYVQSALFIAAILLIFGLGTAKSLDNKTQYLKKLKAELDKISLEVRPLRDLEKRLVIASGTLREKPSSVEVFSEVHRLIPPSMTLTDFIYETGKELILRGQAQELNSVFSLVSQLESSVVFKKFTVKVRYATKRKTSAGEVIGFEIACSKI
jgi:hypothetical protein